MSYLCFGSRDGKVVCPPSVMITDSIGIGRSRFLLRHYPGGNVLEARLGTNSEDEEERVPCELVILLT